MNDLEQTGFRDNGTFAMEIDCIVFKHLGPQALRKGILEIIQFDSLL